METQHSAELDVEHDATSSTGNGNGVNGNGVNGNGVNLRLSANFGVKVSTGNVMLFCYKNGGR